MPVKDGIFDRVDILQAINGSCLGGSGTSSVILGGHKVGKTHLLDHIYGLPAPSRDTLLCRVDVDSLRATLAEAEQLSDSTFLRYFLDLLQHQIERWILTQSLDEPKWKAGVVEATQKLEELADAPANPAARKAWENKKAAWTAQLGELFGLRHVADGITALLSQPEPLRVPQVVFVFNRLQGIRKRIVLVIDEFHRMLTDSAFSDNLFGFLRGANNERKIITLVTSTVSLMDPSLHPVAPANDRQALFNHFQNQVLDPFSVSQAGEFLDWVHGSDAPLTAEEKTYLTEIGGGSPFFLVCALDAFVKRERPAAADRPTFESTYMVPAFEAAMRDLWRRCSPAERDNLQQIAGGKPQPDNPSLRKLEREGYLLRTSKGLVVFSRMFAEYLSVQTGEWVGSDVVVSAEVVEGAIPSALYFGKPDVAAPLITFTIRNPGSEQVKVRVSCTLDGFASTVAALVPVPPRTVALKSLQATFTSKEFATLTDVAWASFTYSAELVQGSGQRLLAQDNKRLLLLGRTDFLFAKKEKSKLRDISWLIAAWVNRTEPALSAIKTRARVQCILEGYAEGINAEGVRAQVAALYEALRAEKIGYDNSLMSFHQEASDYVQRVRFPGQALQQKAANCLDGCVLFASLLSASDLHPIILLIAGHALVGWKTGAGDSAPWEFIETTAGVPFAEALKRGQETYQGVAGIVRTWPEGADLNQFFANMDLFAIAIDVHKVWNVLKVVPLPA